MSATFHVTFQSLIKLMKITQLSVNGQWKHPQEHCVSFSKCCVTLPRFLWQFLQKLWTITSKVTLKFVLGGLEGLINIFVLPFWSHLRFTVVQILSGYFLHLCELPSEFRASSRQVWDTWRLSYGYPYSALLVVTTYCKHTEHFVIKIKFFLQMLLAFFFMFSWPDFRALVKLLFHRTKLRRKQAPCSYNSIIVCVESAVALPRLEYSHVLGGFGPAWKGSL